MATISGRLLLLLALSSGSCTTHSGHSRQQPIARPPGPILFTISEPARKPFKELNTVNFPFAARLADTSVADNVDPQLQVAASLTGRTACIEITAETTSIIDPTVDDLKRRTGSIQLQLKSTAINQKITCDLSIDLTWLQGRSERSLQLIQQVFILPNNDLRIEQP